MVKYALVFAAAFASSLAVGSLAGCVGSDCDCPATPPRPQAQAPLADLTVASYDAQGNFAEPPIAPVAGTLEVTGDTVVIHYQQDSVTFRAVYEIVGP